MHGAATAIVSHSSLVRRFRAVYVTLDCKCWLAHELHFNYGNLRSKPPALVRLKSR